MFIAIVNDSFTAAKDATADSVDFYFHLRDALIESLVHMLALKKARTDLEAADVNNDSMVDLAELEEALKARACCGRSSLRGEGKGGGKGSKIAYLSRRLLTTRIRFAGQSEGVLAAQDDWAPGADGQVRRVGRRDAEQGGAAGRAE